MRATRKRRHGRWAVAVASVLLAVGLVPQSAQAADVPNGAVVPGTIVRGTDIPLDDRATWELLSTETGPVADTRRTRFAAYNSAIEQGVTVKGVANVLSDPATASSGRPLCHATNAAGAEGFCWNSADDLDRTWVPQGLTGSGEAAENQGFVPGRRVVATSWSTTVYHPAGYNGMMKVTFADVTNLGSVKYWTALLVKPTSTTDFAALDGHADSLTWYKNHLYLSTAAGLAVFDLNKIWVMTGTGTGVGMSGTTSSAAGYRYALPQVDRFEHRLANPRSCGSQIVDASGKHIPPCFAGISLDTSGAVPALVTTEVGEIPEKQQQAFDTVRTITRWNLDPATGRLRDASGEPGISRPAELYTSTVSGAQGIAMNRGRFVVAAACPGFIGGDGASEITSCLYHAWPGEPVRLWTRVGVYAQNLSYWPGTDELWTVNEKTNTAVGERTVFHIPWPKPAVPVRSLSGAWGDLTGDGTPDLLAIRPNAGTGSGAGSGNLVLYPGAPHGVGARKSIGTSWDQMRLLTGVGQLYGDKWPDFLAVDGNGDLWLYPGMQDGLNARVKLSAGWGVVSSMTGVGDLTGDGRPDLMAVWNTGDAYLYPGTSGGGLGASHKIGSSWNTMPVSTGAGDLDQDSRPDVLAVDGQGALWLYPGVAGDPAQNVKAGLGPRVQLSTGWGVVRTMTGAGDLTGDGPPDVLAVWNDGSAHLYPGTSGGGLGPSTPVDLGWATV